MRARNAESIHRSPLFSAGVAVVIIVSGFWLGALTWRKTPNIDQFEAVPAGGMAFHVSVIPEEIPWLHSIPRRIILPLRQCFSDLVVVVDLPHGGKAYNKSGSDRGHSEPVYLPVAHSPNILVVKSQARAAIAFAAKLLDAHCPLAVKVRVHVLNHTTLIPWIHSTFKTNQTFTATSPSFADTRPHLPLPQRLFMNTAMYVWSLLHASRAKYLLHTDIDTLGLKNARPFPGTTSPRPTFFKKAMELLETFPDVMFVNPPTSCAMKEPRVVTDRMSCRLFLADTTRFKQLIPLSYWTDHVEEVFNRNLKDHHFRTALRLEGVMPCIGPSWFTRKVLFNKNWQ
eukprot:m.463082 g.463082  ORF g.463082 m.463082 type:complete len:341 (-) comp22908_c0_seq1:185-1207(-)